MNTCMFQVSAGLWHRIKFLFVGKIWIELTPAYIAAIKAMDTGSPGAN